MMCPKCTAADDTVIDSREVADGEAVRRRRRCRACGTRWTTYERMDTVVAASLNELELDRTLAMLDQLRERLLQVRTRTRRLHNVRLG
jgi:transcriptional regulator NrdR family protein